MISMQQTQNHFHIYLFVAKHLQNKHLVYDLDQILPRDDWNGRKVV